MFIFNLVTDIVLLSIHFVGILADKSHISYI